MGLFADLIGTTKSIFQIEKGGVKLENSAGNLVVKDNAGDESDITVKKAFVQGDAIELNSDAAGSEADWKMTIARPATGMTEAVTLTLPPTHGSPGQIITDVAGDGVLTFANPTSTTTLLTVDTTTVNWDSTPGALAMLNLPVGAVVDRVKVVIDTAFNGDNAATLSVGVAGTASKYMAATQVNLKGTAKDVYETNPGEPAVSGSPEACIATFAVATGGTVSAGSARVMIFYTIPA